MSRLSYVAIASIAGFAGTAVAQDAITFAFSNLSASYEALSPTTGFYRAISDVTNTLSSSGAVTRIGSTPGVAEFDEGFSGIGIANAVIELDINIMNPLDPDPTYQATGFYSFIDADGDELTGNIDSSWSFNQGFLFLDDIFSTAMFIDNGTQDGTFDGTAGSGFAFNDLQPLGAGAISLLMGQDTPGRFDTNFNGVAVQAHGWISQVPTPGALSVGAVGLMIASRRRRG